VRRVINTVWKVEHNTGSAAILINRGGRKEVMRPNTMSRQMFLRLLAPGKFIDEDKLRIRFNVLT
jgi:hypothetical protein